MLTGELQLMACGDVHRPFCAAGPSCCPPQGNSSIQLCNYEDLPFLLTFSINILVPLIFGRPSGMASSAIVSPSMKSKLAGCVH